MTHKNKNHGNEGGPKKLEKTSSPDESELDSIQNIDRVSPIQIKNKNVNEYETKEKVVQSLDDKNFLYIPKVYISICC